MGASSARPPSGTEDVRNALKRFATSRPWTALRFTENTAPVTNPREDDYVVTYEAAFEPTDLEQAYLKIFLTERGEVGIGLETRERIARRLGTRLLTGKKAFATGRELASLDCEELIRFIKIVAQGKIALQATVGLAGLGNVRAIVRPKTVAALAPRNSRLWDWLIVSENDLTDTLRTKFLRFEPWR